METGRTNSSLLNEFLTEMENLPMMLIEIIIRNTNSEDEKIVKQSFLEPLSNQFKGISNSILELSRNATAQEMFDVDQILNISASQSLFRTAKQILPNVKSIFGTLSIQQIIFTIKKIINLIFDILNKEKPKWLQPILDLIDEIVNLLLGGVSPKLRSMLSQAELNFMSEQTQLAKLQNATFIRDTFQSEED